MAGRQRAPTRTASSSFGNGERKPKRMTAASMQMLTGRAAAYSEEREGVRLAGQWRKKGVPCIFGTLPVIYKNQVKFQDPLFLMFKW